MSRGRKPKKNKKKSTSGNRSRTPLPLGGLEPRPPRLDANRMVDDLLARVASDQSSDPLVTELAAARLLDADAAMFKDALPDEDVLIGLLRNNDITMIGDAVESDQLDELMFRNGYQPLLNDVIPLLESRGSVESVALLLALGTMAAPDHAQIARGAAERLMTAGVIPELAAQLAEPAELGECLLLTGDPDGLSYLIGTFDRATGAHSAIVMVDDDMEGAADEIVLIRSERLPNALVNIRKTVRADGTAMAEQKLTHTAFWVRVQDALDMRAELERRTGFFDASAEDKDTDRPYPVLAALLDARSNRHSRPSAPRYQLKVSTQGSEPSSWRRIQVPSNLTLSELNDVLQISFGWDGSRPHVFEMNSGTYGRPDTGTGMTSDRRTLLTDVVQPGSSFVYVYDFGGGSRHQLQVEEQLPPPEKPGDALRCVGGPDGFDSGPINQQLAELHHLAFVR